MSSQGRIDSFRGTDAEYITYLELKVQQLTRGARPPSPPTSEGRNEASNQSDGEVVSGDSALIIEQYNPQLHAIVRPAKRLRTEELRWMTEMKHMLQDIPSDWSKRRKEVGLSSQTGILKAFDIIISGAESSTVTSTAGGDAHRDTIDAATLLSTFATTTAALEVHKDFTLQVYHFRVFIQVSLCCVMLSCGVDRNVVDSTMQQCVSKSGGKNLDRLLSGARWVNRIMDVLATEHRLGHLASELFVLWGTSIAQYGRFGDAGEAGFTYFRNLVPACQPGPEIQVSLPFLVPFIIKKIAGPLSSLQEICSSLGYRRKLRTGEYSCYLENYHERRMHLLEPAAPLAGFSSDASDHRGGCEAGAPTFNSIDALLLAAEHSNVLLGSAVNQQISLDCSSTDVLGSPLVAVAGFNPLADRSIFNDLELFPEDEWEALYNEDLELFPRSGWGALDLTPPSRSEGDARD